jgi:hypothetical protein
MQENEGLENTLGMLRDFVYGRIKYKDFNDFDKINLVEIFVTHPTSLLKFYECLFPPPAVQQASINAAPE